MLFYRHGLNLPAQGQLTNHFHHAMVSVPLILPWLWHYLSLPNRQIYTCEEPTVVPLVKTEYTGKPTEIENPSA